MVVSFHWIRVQTFSYATERKDLLEETMAELLGTDELEEDISESEHGNCMTIIEKRLTHQKEFTTLFQNIGKEICDWLIEDVDNRVDEDCVFYLRLDKQAAVQGRYEVAHHGDVIAVTGKLQAHPAKKEAAVQTMLDFLNGLDFTSEASEEES